MEASPNIRSQLDLYLRGELDTNRMSEIKTLIDTDPAWYSTYHALLTEARGIRMTALQDLTSRLQSLEKTIAPQGDLSPSPSSRSTTNETEDLENNYTPPAKGLEALPDPHLIQGIRYTTLRDELRKLQDVERKGSGEVNGKKNDSGRGEGGRVWRMRYWWAVAAGVAVMVVGYYGWYLPKVEMDKRYALYFHPIEYSGEMRGPGDSVNTMSPELKQAIAWYVHGEYRKALQSFESINIFSINEEIKEIYINSLIGNHNLKRAENEIIILSSNKQDSIIQIINKLK
jgi:hypothetical protein